MASTMALNRLKKDYQRLLKDPLPFALAHPLPANILEWHYVVFGQTGTPYEGGVYHGKLVFPADFPFKPPSIYMITPNGRFQTNTRLCLSISDFHPDTWNPAWTVSTIITGLLSFMNDSQPTLGSVTTSESERKQLAKRSRVVNLKNHTFCELFAETAQRCRDEICAEAAAAAAAAAASSSSSRAAGSPGTAAQDEKRRAARRGRGDNQAGGASGWLSSIAVLAGVVALALAARYVVHWAQQQDPAFGGGGPPQPHV